ncbi:hypothetical protein KKH42_01545, partial [bacterium]|nr:hypothetical protein [bacterium]
HVAELAGIPKPAVARAREIMRELEKQHLPHEQLPDSEQISFFDEERGKYDVIIKKIKSADTDNMKPIAALNFIDEVKAELERNVQCGGKNIRPPGKTEK